MNNLRGKQVVYVPTHAGANLKHPDCETGFVTSTKEGVAYVRYWRKGHLPHFIGDVSECLRTKSSSEGTPLKLISWLHQSAVPQEVVDYALQTYCQEES